MPITWMVSGCIFPLGDQSVPDWNAAGGQHVQSVLRAKSDNAGDNGTRGPHGSGKSIGSGAADGGDAAEDAANRSPRGMSTIKLHSSSWGPTWRRRGPVPDDWAHKNASNRIPGYSRRSPKSSVTRLHDAICQSVPITHHHNQPHHHHLFRLHPITQSPPYSQPPPQSSLRSRVLRGALRPHLCPHVTSFRVVEWHFSNLTLGMGWALISY